MYIHICYSFSFYKALFEFLQSFRHLVACATFSYQQPTIVVTSWHNIWFAFTLCVVNWKEEIYKISLSFCKIYENNKENLIKNSSHKNTIIMPTETETCSRIRSGQVIVVEIKREGQQKNIIAWRVSERAAFKYQHAFIFRKKYEIKYSYTYIYSLDIN